MSLLLSQVSTVAAAAAASAARQLPSWTWSGGSVAPGLFITNVMAVASTTIATFSQSVLGDHATFWLLSLSLTSAGEVNWEGTYTLSFIPSVQTAADVGLGSVDNTADADKPVSTAQGEAIGAVQSDATDALADAAAAQSDATTALSNAAAAQSDATDAINDAAAVGASLVTTQADVVTAQATADGSALNPDGISAFGGGFSVAPTQAELEAFAAWVETLRVALIRT